MAEISIHLGWWLKWKEHVKNAKRDPINLRTHSLAAMICQMKYVCAVAEYWGAKYGSPCSCNECQYWTKEQEKRKS